MQMRDLHLACFARKCDSNDSSGLHLLLLRGGKWVVVRTCEIEGRSGVSLMPLWGNAQISQVVVCTASLLFVRQLPDGVTLPLPWEPDVVHSELHCVTLQMTALDWPLPLPPPIVYVVHDSTAVCLIMLIWAGQGILWWDAGYCLSSW